jgi:hypothetical protein
MLIDRNQTNAYVATDEGYSLFHDLKGRCRGLALLLIINLASRGTEELWENHGSSFGRLLDLNVVTAY